MSIRNALGMVFVIHIKDCSTNLIRNLVFYFHFISIGVDSSCSNALISQIYFISVICYICVICGQSSDWLEECIRAIGVEEFVAVHHRHEVLRFREVDDVMRIPWQHMYTLNVVT